MAAEPGPSLVRGQQRITEDFRRAFPDLPFDVDMIIAEGDLVAARWTAEGTNSGSLGAGSRRPVVEPASRA
jgi:predicted ester cyclase